MLGISNRSIYLARISKPCFKCLEKNGLIKFEILVGSAPHPLYFSSFNQPTLSSILFPLLFFLNDKRTPPLFNFPFLLREGIPFSLSVLCAKAFRTTLSVSRATTSRPSRTFLSHPSLSFLLLNETHAPSSPNARLHARIRTTVTRPYQRARLGSEFSPYISLISLNDYVPLPSSLLSTLNISRLISVTKPT